MAETNAFGTEPLQIHELKADNQGNWQFDIDKSLPAGQHLITIEDEYGNQSEVLMYVVSDTTTQQIQPAPAGFDVIERISTAVPPLFSWLIIILLAIIVILSAYLLRLARRADLPGEAIEGGRRRHTRRALIFCAAILLITIVTGLLINRETNFLSYFFPRSAAINLVKLSGRLIDPVTLQGVGNIDLVSGNTSLRTIGSGQYIFDNVSAEKGIRATSPALMRALVFLPPAKAADERMDIYFDPIMYNLLVGIIDLEARGRLGDVYDYLPESVKAKISRDDYQQKAQTIYNSGNIADQDIIIRKTELIDHWLIEKYELRFTKAVAVTVTANGRDDLYHFIYDNGVWTIVK